MNMTFTVTLATQQQPAPQRYNGVTKPRLETLHQEMGVARVQESGASAPRNLSMKVSSKPWIDGRHR
ncbi:hypothetical protein [Herbaspirillum camelliae]|uniref:hypothetical protein n=1 Tax=Herbaspirillum camelliae TaxID=1892903 RepID=UPI000AE72980|nr:hypothetical protein [Herbaspirillum camelliae]